MLKKIFFTIGKYLINTGFNLAFNYVDKDKDGKLSKSEIDNLIADVKKLVAKLKNKNMK